MTGVRDILVVGGGLAGAAAAHDLALAGRDVLLVEREREARDKVCGEFLSHEALHYLARMGVDPAAMGAPAIETVGFAAGARVTLRALPFPARSLSRRRLDEALLARAAVAGTHVRRGNGVKELTRHGGVWTARLDDGSIEKAREAFVASGKHDLKGWPRPPGRQNDLVGLKLHYRLDPEQAAELANRVELFVFAGGYGGLEPIEGELANLCLLVRKERFAEVDYRWDALLAAVVATCTHLGRRLHCAKAVQEKPLAIAAIPYGLVRRTATAGAWHLGDQAAVIPSFSGEGMSIALHSGRLAAECCLAGGSAAQFQRELAADVSRQVRVATHLSRLMLGPTTAPLLSSFLAMVPAGLAVAAKATRLSPRVLRGECRQPSPFRDANRPEVASW